MILKKIKKILFKVARSKISGIFIGFIFEKLSFIIPDKIFQNNSVVVFHHPVKHWEKHILVVPKKSIRSFLKMNLNSEDGRRLIVNIFETGIKVAEIQKMSKYTILVNGGKYQDVPQIHFHLASGKDKFGGYLGNEIVQISKNQKPVFESDQTCIYLVNDKKIKTHFIIKSKRDMPSIGKLDFNNKIVNMLFIDIIKSSQNFLNKVNLSAFTLLVSEGGKKDLFFHIVSNE